MNPIMPCDHPPIILLSANISKNRRIAMDRSRDGNNECTLGQGSPKALHNISSAAELRKGRHPEPG